MVLYNSCGSQWFLGILSGALQFLVGFCGSWQFSVFINGSCWFCWF